MAGGGRSQRKGVPAVGSLVVHVMALGLAWWTSGIRTQPPEFVSYHIEMVAMPAPEPADIPEPAAPRKLVIETPEPTIPAPKPIPPPPPEKAPEKKPEPAPEKKPEEKKPQPTPPPKPAETKTPEAKPAETKARSPDADPDAPGGDAINVRMEGLRRDYPAYYDNIIRQINRCMRWQGAGTPETTVYFVIRKDGKMTELKPLEPSGNIAFDAEALGAVECAGTRFGPLPEDLPYDRLPVRFTIKASGGSAHEDP